MSEKELVSAKEICERFNIPRHALYRLVREGRIPAHKEPNTYRVYPKLSFAPEEVAAALARIKDAQPLPKA